MGSLSLASTPVFLQNLSAKDECTLEMAQKDFTELSWTQLQDIIRRNQLELLQRRPSDLRCYLEYTYKLRQCYGSISAFIIQERLGWHKDYKPHGITFGHQSDWKILWNDWPYGIDPRIVHLVVWTKFALEQNMDAGDLTPEARLMVQDFVDTTFDNKVLWFRNGRILKSVHELEHFHVMLLNPNLKFVQVITDNDIPLYQREIIKPSLNTA